MLIAQRSPAVDNPKQDNFYQYGIVATVLQVIKTPDDTLRILVEGTSLAHIDRVMQTDKYLTATFRIATPLKMPFDKLQAANYRQIAERLFEECTKLSDKIPEDVATSIIEIEDNDHFLDTIAHFSPFKVEQKQRVLESPSLAAKFKTVIELLIVENDILKVQKKITTEVHNQIGHSQKEYYLNEQLKAIEHELGVDKDDDMEFAEIADEIQKSKMPEEAKVHAQKELNRLGKMQPLSPEATVSRTYLEWILDIPWGNFTKDSTSVKAAKTILDHDHYGLTKIKDRIIEFLAVHQLTNDVKGPILCFVGPPGVGKTSLAKSIARALGRNFTRISLGGLHDEAEIRGHRRTYIGSLPGKVVQSLKKAGSMNPVILFDEIDKMSSDFHGDPASAMLEVLDPEQNKCFNDHYLELDLDLSKTLFITTANTQAGIPIPLLDRLEVLRIPGYTEDEKLEIAKRYLVPKQIKANGLTGRAVTITQDAIKTVIDSYTREAGVRNLEREIGTLCRKTACEIVKRRTAKLMARPVVIDPAKVKKFLGPEQFNDSELTHEPAVGTAIGLAWTEVGGEILPIEVLTMSGKGNLLLTGKLGDVMQESAKASLSWIRAHSKELKIAENFYRTRDIHVHVPEGAIPKDGPSAGVTITTALVSAFSGLPVRQDTAMTGEITLRGNVLKIGGLKEKVLAAHRHHITRIIIPADNVPDLEELAKKIREQLTIIPVKNITEVLDNMLLKHSPSIGKRRPAPHKRGIGVRRRISTLPYGKLND